ncbi:MAG: hypothetical protein KJ630_15190 [Proteobacteria bacterium]|nr:hypothetical protein [Pseudomonadota bacterium]
MKTVPLDVSQPIEPSFKIKGRMIPYEEITCRLKNFCISLGFGPGTINRKDLPPSGYSVKSAGEMRWQEDEDMMLVFSTHVTYNPHWGGYSGLPRLLHYNGSKRSPGHSPAEFIAPFLHRYRFAQDNIFINHTSQGQYLITIPNTLLNDCGECSEYKLKLHLKKIVEPAKDGAIYPVSISGEYHSFVVSNDFCLPFSGLIDGWTTGRKLTIGKYLSRELFSFTFDEKVLKDDSPYVATILPHIEEIVADTTPNLRAAQIHLQKVFDRDMTRLSVERHERSKKLLYIAGLEIDMTAFAGIEEHYFVPWQAYIAAGGKAPGEEYLLLQDDLFVQLKQQDAHCLV